MVWLRTSCSKSVTSRSGTQQLRVRLWVMVRRVCLTPKSTTQFWNLQRSSSCQNSPPVSSTSKVYLMHQVMVSLDLTGAQDRRENLELTCRDKIKSSYTLIRGDRSGWWRVYKMRSWRSVHESPRHRHKFARLSNVMDRLGLGLATHTNINILCWKNRSSARSKNALARTMGQSLLQCGRNSPNRQKLQLCWCSSFRRLRILLSSLEHP